MIIHSIAPTVAAINDHVKLYHSLAWQDAKGRTVFDALEILQDWGIIGGVSKDNPLSALHFTCCGNQHRL